jgi:hypothetical protein
VGLSSLRLSLGSLQTDTAGTNYFLEEFTADETEMEEESEEIGSSDDVFGDLDLDASVSSQSAIEPAQNELKKSKTVSILPQPGRKRSKQRKVRYSSQLTKALLPKKHWITYDFSTNIDLSVLQMQSYLLSEEECGEETSISVSDPIKVDPSFFSLSTSFYVYTVKRVVRPRGRRRRKEAPGKTVSKVQRRFNEFKLLDKALKNNIENQVKTIANLRAWPSHSYPLPTRSSKTTSSTKTVDK